MGAPNVYKPMLKLISIAIQSMAYYLLVSCQEKITCINFCNAHIGHDSLPFFFGALILYLSFLVP